MADAPKTTPPGSPKPDKVEPKIVQKLAIRTLLAVVLLGGLFFGLRSWLGYSRDPGSFGFVATTDSIAAIEFLDNGQQAVVIRPDGSFLRSPDFKTGDTERDLAWQPDGARLYYVSDRENQTFQVYRWRPIEGGESEARTLGTRGKSNPAFAPGATAKDFLLIASMGTIQELDPIKRATRQVLPPMLNEVPQGTSDEEGGGGSSLFRALYGELGDSFARAQFLPGNTAIAAVMRGTRGDVLILQDLQPGENGKMKPPLPLTAGDRVDFAIANDGTIVYTVQNFTYPTDAAMKANSVNNRPVFPFRHAISLYRTKEQKMELIAASKNDEAAFGQPALSPDGTRLLVVVGKYDGTNLTPSSLVVMPARENGGAGVAPLVTPAVYEPTWHPNGKKIAYVKREGGKRAIFTANDDGTDEKNITGVKGDFARPLFSPHLAK